MGFWPIWRYKEFVANHASPAERRSLAQKPRQLWDNHYQNIYVAFKSLPAWMSVSNIISLNDRDINFRSLVEIYQLHARQHFESVKPWLDQIRTRFSGLALLAEIAASQDYDVLILPYRGKGDNAEAGFGSVDDEIDGTARGAPLQPIWNPFEEDPDPRRGTGAGADSLVRFTPGIFTGARLSKPGNAPDEVLFHELVHSSRALRGVQDEGYADQDYDDQEEFIAIVIANIYLSEKGQQVLLGDHDNKPLQGVERDNWLNNSQHMSSLSPRMLITNFKRSQKDFYTALANLPVPPRWNPVRDHNDFSRSHDTTPFF